MFPSELVASTSSLSCLLTQSLVCGFARGPKCLVASGPMRPTIFDPRNLHLLTSGAERDPGAPNSSMALDNLSKSSSLQSPEVSWVKEKSKIREVNQKSDTQLCLPIAHDFHQASVRKASTSHNSPLPSGKSSSTASCKSDTLMPPAKLDSCLRILESDSTALTLPFFITGCVWRCHQFLATHNSTVCLGDLHFRDWKKHLRKKKKRSKPLSRYMIRPPQFRDSTY